MLSIYHLGTSAQRIKYVIPRLMRVWRITRSHAPAPTAFGTRPGSTRRYRAFFALWLASNVLVGCKQSVDLDAVRALQTAADNARESYDDLAADYYGSCVRTVEYQNISSSMSYEPTGGSVATGMPLAVAPAAAGSGALGSSDTAAVVRMLQENPMRADRVLAVVRRADLLAVLAQLSPERRAALIAAVAASVPTPRAVSTECASSRAASADWQAANLLLIAYFDSLGNLAGAPRGEDAFGMSRLATSIHAEGVFSADQASSIGKLGNDIAAGVFDAKRRGNLAQYIGVADATVGTVVAALQSAASDHYVFALRQESDEMEGFLQRNFIAAKPGLDAFEVLQYGDSWSSRRAALESRRSAAASYVASLQKLRDAHADLLKAISQNDSAAAFAIAETAYDSMQPDIKAMRKAFEAK